MRPPGIRTPRRDINPGVATKHVALRIAPELCDEVDAEAAAQGKSRNDMLNYLIDSGLHGLKRYKEDLRKALTSKGLL